MNELELFQFLKDGGIGIGAASPIATILWLLVRTVKAKVAAFEEQLARLKEMGERLERMDKRTKKIWRQQKENEARREGRKDAQISHVSSGVAHAVDE
jgi:hypothetical protein